jgi:hypothetical protein
VERLGTGAQGGRRVQSPRPLSELPSQYLSGPRSCASPHLGRWFSLCLLRHRLARSLPDARRPRRTEIAGQIQFRCRFKRFALYLERGRTKE